MSTDETLYDAAKLLLEYTITKYYNYNGRTAPLSFASMLTKIQTDYDAAVVAGLTQTFLDNQVTRMMSFIKLVADVLINEIDLEVIPSSDNLYFSGIFSPTSQDTSSYTIQTHHMFNDQPTGTMSSLVSTNIASTPRNIASFITGTDHFTQYSTTIRAGVWQSSIYATTTSVATPFPVMYTELVEVELDGTTQVGTVVATGTSTYGTTITGDGVFEVFLTVPLRVMGSTTNRLKLLLWAVNSDGTSTNVDLTLKINKLAMSNTETTIENITQSSVNLTGIQSIQGSKTFTGNTTLHGGAVVGNGLNGQIMYFDAEEDWIWKTDTTGSTNALVLKDATGDNSFIMEKFDNTPLIEFDLSTSAPGIISSANISAPDIVLVGGAYAGSLQSTLTEYYTGIETDALISNLIDSSPALLNTLNELAAAIGDDENFSVTVANTIANLSTTLSDSASTGTGTNNLVHKVDDETIGGIKTFSVPIVASGAPTTGSHLTNKTYVDAQDASLQSNITSEETARTNADTAILTDSTNNIVHKLYDETIGGIKTFSVPIVASGAPSTGSHLTNKTYVDTQDNALSTTLSDSDSSGTGTNNLVHKAGTETIAGGKTFTDNMIIKNSNNTASRLDIIIPASGSGITDARITVGESASTSDNGKFTGYLKYEGVSNKIALGNTDNSLTDRDMITYNIDSQDLEFNPTTTITNKIGGNSKLTITSSTTTISNTLAITGFSDVADSITTNATNIATNASNISSNDTDIATNASNITNLSSTSSSGTNVNNIVHKTNNETIGGEKTFTSTARFTAIMLDDADLMDQLDSKYTIEDMDITLGNITLTDGGTITTDDGAITDLELYSLHGITSNAQTQLTTLQTEMTAVEASVTTNTTNISTNASNIALKADDDEVVKLTGTQTIAGRKIFTGELITIGDGTEDLRIFRFNYSGTDSIDYISKSTGLHHKFNEYDRSLQFMARNNTDILTIYGGTGDGVGQLVTVDGDLLCNGNVAIGTITDVEDSISTLLTDVGALDTAAVKITGAQTIDGIKLFNDVIRTKLEGNTHKISLYGSQESFTMGLNNIYDFGAVSNWAMIFTVYNDGNNGWLWRKTTHGPSAGSMSLSTTGVLTVASKIRVGYTENDTTTATSALEVDGDAVITGQVTAVTGTSSGQLVTKSYVDTQDTIINNKADANETAITLKRSLTNTDYDQAINISYSNAKLIIHSPGTATPSIELIRNSTIFGNDNQSDWRIQNIGGNLEFIRHGGTNGSAASNPVSKILDFTGSALTIGDDTIGISLLGDVSGIGTLAIAGISNVRTTINLKADDDEVVKLTGNQTIRGEKELWDVNYFRANTNRRNSLGFWGSGDRYCMGFYNGGSTVFGAGNSWVMTNTMATKASATFAWLWRASDHTDSEGSMSLTTNGILTVAEKIRVGYGEDDTVTATDALEVSGNADITGTLAIAGISNVRTTIEAKADTSSVVTLADVQTITGIKTFSNPVKIDPTFAVNKIQLYTPSDSYCIGLNSGYSYGTLNGVATVFSMGHSINASGQGWLWRGKDQGTGEGAMSLSGNGTLTVSEKLRVGYGEGDTVSAINTFECGGTLQLRTAAVNTGSILKFTYHDSNGYINSGNGNSFGEILFETNEDIASDSPAGSTNGYTNYKDTCRIRSEAYTDGALGGDISTALSFWTRNGGTDGSDPMTQKMIINPDGNVGIGVDKPSSELEVDGDISATSYITTSDKRLKTNIEYVNTAKALETISKIQPATYFLEGKHESQYGVIAQDLKEILPSAVKLNGKRFMPSISELCELTNDGRTIILSSKQTSVITTRRLQVLSGNGSKQIVDILDFQGDYQINLQTNITEYSTLHSDGKLKIFVYGHQIDDLHSVNYPELFTLNIAATKELYLRSKEQEKTIESLQSELSAIKSFLHQEFPEKFTMT
jgi:hypothetical protein